MNTVDTERLEQLRTIGVPFAGATNDDIRVFDCRILLEWATSLTNEAELRGRVDELERALKQGKNWEDPNEGTVYEIKKRLAALLKLKGGEEKQ